MSGLFSSPKAPAVPDPTATAAAQATANKETAISQAGLNATNQVTPYGNLTYTKSGTWEDGTPQFTATQTLNPTQQQSLDAQQQIELGTSNLGLGQIGRISDAISTPFSLDKFGAAPKADDAARQQVIDSLYSQQKSRLDPQFADSQTALTTRLANQGISEGTDAYSNAMRDFNFGKNDAYQTAQNQAINAGGAEQSRLYGLQSDQYQNSINNDLTARNQPINELAALLGSGGGVQQPNYTSTPQTGVSGTDVIGATALSQNAANNNYNQQMGARNALIGALGGAAGSAGGAYAASDRRLKRNIRKIGKLGRINAYAYNYAWNSADKLEVGVMAQEVPQAAVRMKNGYLAVNYALLGKVA